MSYMKNYYEKNKEKWKKYNSTQEYKEYQRTYHRNYKSAENGYYVYFLLDKKKEVKYVGSTINMYKRMSSHKISKTFSTILYKDLTNIVTTELELLIAENYYIDKYKDSLENNNFATKVELEEKHLEDLLYNVAVEELREYKI